MAKTDAEGLVMESTKSTVRASTIAASFHDRADSACAELCQGEPDGPYASRLRHMRRLRDRVAAAAPMHTPTSSLLLRQQASNALGVEFAFQGRFHRFGEAGARSAIRRHAHALFEVGRGVAQGESCAQALRHWLSGIFG